MTYPRHGLRDRHPARELIDGEEPGWITVHEVLDFAIVASITVSRIDLLDSFTDHATLLNTSRVVRQVEYRRVIVLVANLHSKITNNLEQSLVLKQNIFQGIRHFKKIQNKTHADAFFTQLPEIATPCLLQGCLM